MVRVAKALRLEAQVMWGLAIVVEATIGSSSSFNSSTATTTTTTTNTITTMAAAVVSGHTLVRQAKSNVPTHSPNFESPFGPTAQQKGRVWMHHHLWWSTAQCLCDIAQEVSDYYSV